MNTERLGPKIGLDPLREPAPALPSDVPRRAAEPTPDPFEALLPGGSDPKLIGVSPEHRRNAPRASGPLFDVLGHGEGRVPGSDVQALVKEGLDLLAAAKAGAALGAEPFEPSHDRVLKEYDRLSAWVATLKPDRQVGGLLNEKDLGNGLSILWKTDTEHTTLRLFQERGRNDYFDVTFHRSPHIVENRTVVRRFIGYPRLWRADTVDAQSGEYLGRQGLRSLSLLPEDRATLERQQIGMR